MKHQRTIIAILMALTLSVPAILLAGDYNLGGLTITVGTAAPWKLRVTPAKIACTLSIGGESLATANITVEPRTEGQTALGVVTAKGADLKELMKKEVPGDKQGPSGAEQVATGVYEGRQGEFGTLQQAYVAFVVGDRVAVVEIIAMKDKFEKHSKHIDALLDSLSFKRVP